ncbi:MAG TPA: multiheme c-type cytochrome [Vicinamibacterales bacterium]|nr:multiheme c-type cytochrome [Vicinamibacterales bacterium]
MRFRDVEHLFRLAALFGVGVIVFAIARATLVPHDFGTLGHFRAGAIAEARALPIVHAGQKACAECHDDVVEARAAARHKNISCESCHGPLGQHALGEGPAPVKPDAMSLCVRCHAAKTGKPTRYPTVDVADHAGGESCLSCHTSHDPRAQ